MPAPTLGESWQLQLMLLHDNWDSYGGKPISESAIRALESFSAVPCSSGGIQLEIHRDGYDIEIGISPDGRIESVIVCHSPSPATCST